MKTTEAKLKVKFRSPYDEDRVRTPLCCGPSRTKQQFKDECDINNIMGKYLTTGMVTHLSGREGSYADLADAPTFQEAQNILVEAERAFQSLPSAIRVRFNHSPAEFLDFVHDPVNATEMVKMGLAKASASVPPSPTQDRPTGAPDGLQDAQESTKSKK